MMPPPLVYVVDDDAAVRDGMLLLMESAGLRAKGFESAEAFLDEYRQKTPGCLVLDVHMPEIDGLQLQSELARQSSQLPIIFLTGYGDIPTSVRAMKGGAFDFLTKPVNGKVLVQRVQHAVELSEAAHRSEARLQTLTQREREILKLAVAGKPNKGIARELGISYRTVEVHRSRILLKTGASTLLELAHVIAAAQSEGFDSAGEDR
jgi:FixJ family two-component response regulator